MEQSIEAALVESSTLSLGKREVCGGHPRPVFFLIKAQAHICSPPPFRKRGGIKKVAVVRRQVRTGTFHEPFRVLFLFPPFIPPYWGGE